MRINKIEFLKDVLHCALVAYGGPEAHYGVFIDVLVKKKKYVTEEELLELMALTNFLPGPSSTQTIISIGYKIGGLALSILTFLIWIIPALFLMIILSFSATILLNIGLDISIFKYLTPMAVGFIIYASYAILKKVINNRFSAILSFFSAGIIYLYQYSVLYIVLIIFGGVIAIFYKKNVRISMSVKIKFNWSLLISFILLSIFIAILPAIYNSKIVELFSSFYKYGYLVIGGGNVVIPMMFTEFVDYKNYVSNIDFLNGFALTQAVPGPMFSFSAYIASVALSGESIIIRVFSALLSGLAIFLPGTLLIYFVYPIWDKLKSIEIVDVALKGIVAVTSGFIFITPLLIIKKNEFILIDFLVIVVVFLSLFYKKIPPVILVILTIIAGILF